MKTEISWKRRLLRKKLKYMLFSVLIVAVIFVVHQLFYFKELDQAIIGKLITGSAKDFHRAASEDKKAKWDKHSKLIRDQSGRTVSLRGTRDQDIFRYLPNARGKFVCFKSQEEVDFVKINDDYCDCPSDGSDEPGTNACNSGAFNCDVPSLKFPGKIPSYKVNDGYCDCCDGSDEWAEVALAYTLVSTGISYHKVKCSNRC